MFVPTTPSMVERVAKALAGATPGRAHFEQARRAIEAMREPSGMALRAGHQHLVALFEEEAESYGAAHDVWQSMIDATLKE